VEHVANRIRDFIQTELLFEDGNQAVADNTPLLGGVMDSLALMQLVAFLEEEFKIEVDEDDITASHFRTIADIEHLVQEKARHP
jgi:acyl carrier protein